MAFKDTLKLVKDSIGNLMTKEGITDADLDNLTKLNQQVDTLAQDHQELVDSHNSMKDKYIAVLTKGGTSAQPQYETDAHKEKSLEEIAQEVIAKDKNDKKGEFNL